VSNHQTDRFAAVDLGTNSSILLIVEHLNDSWSIVIEDFMVTRLGEGLSNRGMLLPSAIERTLKVLTTFSQHLDNWGVNYRAAVGTSALRRAINASPFIDSASQILKCPIEIISGEREAQLTFRGVRSGLFPSTDQYLILDVGGGSTELLFCENNKLSRPVCLELGAVRLTEKYFSFDPPDSTSLAAVQTEIFNVLNSEFRFDKAAPYAKLIGVGGTITTLAAVQLALPRYDRQQIDGVLIDQLSLESLLQRFVSLSLDQRRNIIGLEAERADIIIAGCLIIKGITQYFGLQNIQVSDRGLRWGVVEELRLQKLLLSEIS